MLDGHASRKGWEWIDKSIDLNIEVVQNPTNTSHFVQICDSEINKMFKKSCQDLRDKLAGYFLVNFGQMRMKLMLLPNTKISQKQ